MVGLRSLLPGRRKTVGVARERLSDGTYVELVQSLFDYAVPALIMTLCFVATGAYLVARTDDLPLLALYLLGVLTSAARLGLLFGLRPTIGAPGVGINIAIACERRFGTAYIAFAAAFGFFCAYAYAIVDIDLHIPLVALVIGYAAGVAATVALRPWISIPAVLIAVVPIVVVSLFEPGFPNWGTGILMALFLAGGVKSMIQRYGDATAQITMRRLMESLARQDDLTGLPNRLVLRERFEQIAARADESELIAVHCVDINQLDPVNEMYGHMAGDALLKAVAQRLRRVVRGDNLVIHLNGDDFVVIQPGLIDSRDADLLAHQIVGTLDKSYAVAGEDIIITANVGYSIDMQRGADLERLLLAAERALTTGKRGASGVQAYDHSRWDGGAAGRVA